MGIFKNCFDSLLVSITLTLLLLLSSLLYIVSILKLYTYILFYLYWEPQFSHSMAARALLINKPLNHNDNEKLLSLESLMERFFPHHNETIKTFNQSHCVYIWWIWGTRYSYRSGLNAFRRNNLSLSFWSEHGINPSLHFSPFLIWRQWAFWK